MTQQQPPDWFTELSAGQHAPNTGPPADPNSPETVDKRRRRRRTRRIVAIVSTVVVLALIGTYADLTLTAPIGAAASTVHRPAIDQPAAAQLALPGEGEFAISISGGDAYLGPKADGIFASSGGNGKLPMASISKLITAMVILSAHPLSATGAGPTIAWTAADITLYDKYYLQNATIAAMKSGSTMSEHDALETMLVVSACNYAEAMADWAFGSQANFLYQTRLWLHAHGMNSTTMVESTGIDPQNVSTPSDLITLGKLAMANPAIAGIVSKTSLDVPSLAGMPNTNDLIGTDGINGIKTGTFEGSDLLFSATMTAGLPTPLKVIGVELGGASRGSVDADVTGFLSSVTAGFHTVELGSKGESVGSYSTPWGSQANMVLSKSASTVTWSNTPISSTMTTTRLKTGAVGETVGDVTWTIGTTKIAVPVVLNGKVHGPTAWWRLTHPKELLGR